MEELRDCISFVDSREEVVRLSAPERLTTFSATFLDALTVMSDEERVRERLKTSRPAMSFLLWMDTEPCVVALSRSYKSSSLPLGL